MSLYALVEMIHILSAAVLFGTGAGIAYFMLMAWRSKNMHVFAAVSNYVVFADFLFTTTAVIVQPVSGILLIILGGHDPFSTWLFWVYGLFVFVGICWLPVVMIQLKIRNLAKLVLAGDEQAERQISRLMRLWFALGWPAFAGVLAIYFLMIVKP